MSRVVTPPQAQSGNTQQVKIAHEKIAMRAYEKWVKRGQPQGTDVQDWMEAEAELRAEISRSSTTSTGSHTHPTGTQHSAGMRR